MVQLQRVKGEDGLVLNWCPGFTALIEPLVCDAGKVEGISSSNRTDQGVVLTHNWPTRGVNQQVLTIQDNYVWGIPISAIIVLARNRNPL